MLSLNASTSSAQAFTYDNNGNMTSVTNTCGTTTYTWDARNRLVGISGFDALCSPLSAAFQYDALGRRIGKTINGRTIQYVYDGLDIVQEIENGLPSVNYIRTLNIDEPLARLEANGRVRYYQADALGSVIALTDENGVVKTTYSYDPFGNVTVTGEASDNPFQYTNRENDNTGLYYYRARYYSPELQRFISEDPIGLKGGINQYVYVGNDPVNQTDSMGLSPDGPIIGNPPGGSWPPPPPGDLCETGCYLTLFNDYYWCNVGWSYGCLNDPLHCDNKGRGASDCKRRAYDKYQKCIGDCKKKKCPPKEERYWRQG